MLSLLRNLGIKTKLSFAFGIAIILSMTIGGLGLYTIHNMAEDADVMYSNVAEPLAVLQSVTESIQRARVAQRDILLATDQVERQTHFKQTRDLIAKADSGISRLEATLQTEEEKQAYTEVKKVTKDVFNQYNSIAALAFQGMNDIAIETMAGVGLKEVEQRELFDKIVKSKTSFSALVNMESQKTTVNNYWIISLLIVLGVGASLVVGYLLSSSITKPVFALNEQASRIAAGDLTVQVDVAGRDEIGKLAETFSVMVENLRNTIGQVLEASSSVASAATEISSSTEEMAAASEEQSSGVSEVASAVEEMSSTIGESASSASQAADTAARAKQKAENGGKIVDNTIAGMRRIADVVRKSAETVKELGRSSDHIGEIVSVIDDIADQTNLLALNAAIEAARAGEQGRGFAVVADEVRKLAERTSKATKEIAGMIRAIQQKTREAVDSMNQGNVEVDAGITAADQAGSALSEIVQISNEVTSMVTHIAAASEQQSKASTQITRNVESISTAIREMTNGTQQVARSADDLSQLTTTLQDHVSQFKLSDSVGGRKQSDVDHASAQDARDSIQEHGSLVVRPNGKLLPAR